MNWILIAGSYLYITMEMMAHYRYLLSQDLHFPKAYLDSTLKYSKKNPETFKNNF